MTYNLDAATGNADWIKYHTWDLPTNVGEFLYAIGGEEQLDRFMALPAATAMPPALALALADRRAYKAVRPSGLRHVKYSPDQPRDAQGRFGEGEGLAGEAAEGLSHGNLPMLKGDQYFAALSPEAQARVVADQEKFGYDPKAAYVHIKDTVGDATNANVLGSQWYPNLNDTIGKISEMTNKISNGERVVDPEKIAAIIGDTCIKVPWATNIEATARMAQMYAAGGFTKSDGALMTAGEATAAFKAEWQEQGWGGQKMDGTNSKLAIMDGDETRPGVYQGMSTLLGYQTPEEDITTVKLRSFDNNMLSPGRTQDVTVDNAHMSKVGGFIGISQDDMTTFMGSGRGLKSFDLEAGSGYVSVAESVRTVANEWGVSPDTLQAAYWVSILDKNPDGWEEANTGGQIDKPSPFVDELTGRKAGVYEEV